MLIPVEKKIVLLTSDPPPEKKRKSSLDDLFGDLFITKVVPGKSVFQIVESIG